jgi:hypothetical protein
MMGDVGFRRDVLKSDYSTALIGLRLIGLRRVAESHGGGFFAAAPGLVQGCERL